MEFEKYFHFQFKQLAFWTFGLRLYSSIIRLFTLTDLWVDLVSMLKSILNKQNVSVWTGLNTL